MIAAGLVRRVIFGYIGNPGIGLGHAFRRAVAAGAVELEEWTNFSMILRLHAGRLGVPFLPARILGIGDQTTATAGVGPRLLPLYRNRGLAAIPALVPDVALIHAQQADPEGNVQLWGVDGDTVEGALARRTHPRDGSKRIVPRENPARRPRTHPTFPPTGSRPSPKSRWAPASVLGRRVLTAATTPITASMMRSRAIPRRWTSGSTHGSAPAAGPAAATS